MAREIQLLLDNNLSSFAFKKVSRNDLYGFKKRIPLGNDDQPCVRAQIDEDTGQLIPSGGLEGVYINQNFSNVEKNDLVAKDSNNQTIKKFDSTLGTPQKIEPINVEDLLSLEVTSVYALTPSSLDSKLETALSQNQCFQFSFNYYSDYNLETGVLIQSGENIFALIGNLCPSDWVEENTQPSIIEEIQEEEELDFQMF
tara:strand:+ start:3529 stop:4125 length:597 start_codon:yes stop_codon:yes gene_type:complete